MNNLLNELDIIENKTLDEERALYNTQNAIIRNCNFDGIKDGESAIKECRNLKIDNCYFNLRYPIWHVNNVTIDQSTMSNNCRAALWYSNIIKINQSKLLGIKALRECSDIEIIDSEVESSEFGWKSKNIDVKNTIITGEYAFFETNNLIATNLTFKGKYSFQYVRNLEITDSLLDTKDAFWHAENIVVKNSHLKGEYLAWYAKNITFINCIIEGTQPLCYASDIKMIDCKMINCDLAFENTNVNAIITGHINSIKNPLSGKIIVDSVGEVIMDDTLYNCHGEVITRK